MNTKLERRSFLEKGALGVAALAFAGGSLAKPASGGTQDLFGQVNRAKDLENMSPLEKKHVPEIHIPKKVKAGEPFEISIKVNHVMNNGHFIQWLEIYDRDLFLARVDFTAVKTRAEAKLTLVLRKSTKLNVFERCNLHGLWENSVPVEVV